MKRTVHRLQLNVTCFSMGRFKQLEHYNDAPFTIRLLSMDDTAAGRALIVGISQANDGIVIQSGTTAGLHHWGDTLRDGGIVLTVLKNDAHFMPSGQYLVYISPEDQTALSFMGRTSILPSADGTNVVEMGITDPIPKRGEDVLNTLYEVYTQANVEDQNTTADNTIDFINNRLAIVQKELSGVENNIQDFKTRNKVTDISDQSKMAVGDNHTLEQEAVQQQLRVEVLNSVEDYLKKTESRAVPPSLVDPDPTYTGLVQKYNTLVAERDNLLANATPHNPVVVQMNARIDTMKRDIIASLENVRQNLAIASRGLNRRLDEVGGALREAPAKERTFLDISREQQVKQQLYLFLLQKREETAISKSGTLANSRLIEPARREAAPISPNARNIYLTGLALGLIVPGALIFLLSLVHNQISGREDVTGRTEAPILGEIGHNRSGESLIMGNNARSILAEQFRMLRTNLQYMTSGRRNQFILITSSMSGEGKTFISTNIAGALAITGKKVALLELDLRKPRVSSDLKLDNDRGFTSFIVSNDDMKYLPKPVPNLPGLYVISSGPVPPNPAEMLMQDKVKTLFDYLGANFDYIVIDTPPIGLVSDALLLAPYADACIYITRVGYTRKPQITLIEELFQQRKMKGLSVVINDMKANKGTGYGYRYGYGYGYGHGSGYYNDDEGAPKGWQKLFSKRVSSR
jgi:capsular exopolysaccharide synthesis family protein